MYALVFQRKPWLYLANRLNSLKHVQQLNAHNSNQKNRKGKKILSLQHFSMHATLRNIQVYRNIQGTVITVVCIQL